MTDGLIPYQPLTNRRHQPLSFLSWVDGRAITPHVALDATVMQLAETFFALAQGYGLRLAEVYASPTSFLKGLWQPGQFLIHTPTLYLRCSDRAGIYLAFDWLGWLQASTFVTGGSDDIHLSQD